jgi:hypothetical protein
MERFVYSIDDDRLSERLDQAIRGRGAFRRFKDLIYNQGIEDEWHAFRTRSMEQIVLRWLNDHGIPWRRSDDGADSNVDVQR